MFSKNHQKDPVGSLLRSLVNLEYAKRGYSPPADDVEIRDVVLQLELWVNKEMENHG